MVAKVYGRVDSGERIDFAFNGKTGLWEAAAPEMLKGTYLVEVYAEDYAGNIAYVTSILCTIDMTQVCVLADISECRTDVEKDNISSILSAECMTAVKEDDYMVDVLSSTCDIDVVRCEICGRW